MKLPQTHLADETLARVLVAAKRVRKNHEQAAADAELELVDLPASLMPSAPANPSRTPEPAAANPPPAQAAPEVPPLNESGLNTGAVLHGADSFDALLGS